MGVGAAFTMPTTLAIITYTFEGRERSRAIAIWAAFPAIGGGIGLIGGAITKYLTWQYFVLDRRSGVARCRWSWRPSRRRRRRRRSGVSTWSARFCWLAELSRCFTGSALSLCWL
jgi:MFS family permease